MIRQIVNVKDYYDLGQQYEHYIWHFVRKNQCESTLVIKPFLLEKCDIQESAIESILEFTTVPYFESYIDESFDFLYENGLPIDVLWDEKIKIFNPVLVAFNKYKIVNATYYNCYSIEGFIEVISSLDIKYFSDVN